MTRLRLDPDLAAVHLNDAFRYGESQAGATFLLGDGIVGLLELLKQLGLVGSGNAGAGVTNRDMECAIVRLGLDGDFTCIGKLDGITDEIDQNLRQTTSVAVPGWQFGGKLELERELLVGRQWLKRAADGLGNILN